MFTVYVLRNPDGRLYIGQTNDLDRRLQQHQTGESRWSRHRGPWQLALTESYPTRAQAMCRERALKSGVLNQQLRAKIEQHRGGAGPPEKD